MSLKYLLGPEHETVPWIALVGAITVVLFAVILVLARRQRSYASASLSLLAVAYAGVALASCFALWTINRTLQEMAVTGGGIGAIAFGIWQAARLPLASAWIAMAATLLALAIALLSSRGDALSPRAKNLWWMAGIAVAAGVSAVLAFRGTVAFIMSAILPGRQPWWLTGDSVGNAIYTRLLGAGVVSALCVLVALVLAVVSFRRGAAPRRAVVAVLVVSLGVSVAMVASLGSISSRFRGVALGSSDGLDDLLQSRPSARVHGRVAHRELR